MFLKFYSLVFKKKKVMSTGFARNHSISPLNLYSLPSSEMYKTVYKNEYRQKINSEIPQFQIPTHTALERSGFWSNENTNRVGLTPYQMKTESLQPKEKYDEKRLARIKHYDPIQAERGGHGPEWGDTTYNSAMSLSARGVDRRDEFFSMNRNLIGKRTGTAYSKEFVLLPTGDCKGDSIYQTTNQLSYSPPSMRMRPRMTQYRNVRMETSGYQMSNGLLGASPTAMTPFDQPPKNQIRPPMTSQSLNSYNITSPRRKSTGYQRNEKMTVGTPGDRRLFETGKTISMHPLNGRRKPVGYNPPLNGKGINFY